MSHRSQEDQNSTGILFAPSDQEMIQLIIYQPAAPTNGADFINFGFAG